MVDVEIWMGE